MRVINGGLFIYESKDPKVIATGGNRFRGVLFSYACPPQRFDGESPEKIREYANTYLERIKKNLFEEGVDFEQIADESISV